MSDDVSILREGVTRERRQAYLYRVLAGDAEMAGRAAEAERLNELLADEQHHVSRLAARLMELGAAPPEDEAPPAPPSPQGWEEEARAREADEVRWYERAVATARDPDTRAVLRQILDSERHHHRELAGKWMSADAATTREETP